MRRFLRILREMSSYRCDVSGAARPKIFGEAIHFYFKWAAVFCLGHCLSKHKMTRYTRNLGGGMAPWPQLTTPMRWESKGWRVHPPFGDTAQNRDQKMFDFPKTMRQFWHEMPGMTIEKLHLSSAHNLETDNLCLESYATVFALKTKQFCGPDVDGLRGPLSKPLKKHNFLL